MKTDHTPTKIPTIEEMETETAGMGTAALHELSIRLKAELALAMSRISGSKLKRLEGERVSNEDIHQMNLEAGVLRARCEHMKIIYLRRSQQRSESEHTRLMAQVIELQKENDGLKAEVKRLRGK